MMGLGAIDAVDAIDAMDKRLAAPTSDFDGVGG
jgi:hypothetical protein